MQRKPPGYEKKIDRKLIDNFENKTVEIPLCTNELIPEKKSTSHKDYQR